MSWWLRLVRDPADALDLYDPKRPGQLDHAKVIGFFVFACLYGMAWYELLALGRSMNTAKWVVLCSVSFGWLGWRMFLRTKTATLTSAESFVEQVTRTGKAADPDDEL